MRIRIYILLHFSDLGLWLSEQRISTNPRVASLTLETISETLIKRVIVKSFKFKSAHYFICSLDSLTHGGKSLTAIQKYDRTAASDDDDDDDAPGAIGANIVC